MKAVGWSLCLLALPLCLGLTYVPGTHSCSCNGIINSRGQGECRTSYRGKPFCYVDRGTCYDEKKSTSPGWYWSYDACKNHRVQGPECYALTGERCQFPFTWGGRTFTSCTTYKSANGAAWCATRVQGGSRQAARGSLEDCAAPCDHGASPYTWR